MAINIKKNDTVIVLTGKDKGTKGLVSRVISSKGKLIVEGVNKVKRHEKPSATNQTGGIVEKEMPIDVSNVMVVDPKTGEPTRIRRERVNGKPSVRVAVKNGNKLD